jgi:hypothetical protein
MVGLANGEHVDMYTMLVRRGKMRSACIILEPRFFMREVRVIHVVNGECWSLMSL